MTGHTSNPVIYFIVFGALIALTLLTVVVAQAPIGEWHTPIGLAIAIAKTSLVVLFFMHAIHSERVTWLVIFTSVCMLLLVVIGILADYWSRAGLLY